VLATKEDEKNCKQKNITTDDDDRTWIAGMTNWNCTIKFCGHPYEDNAKGEIARNEKLTSQRECSCIGRNASIL
jgi:hypothetical protein